MVRRAGQARWIDFCYRYHLFLPEDTVEICTDHHAEIHRIYDDIIQVDIRRVGRPLSKYSWSQAETLMKKLRAACQRWLKIQTPGIDPNEYAAYREKLRKQRMRSMLELED